MKKNTLLIITILAIAAVGLALISTGCSKQSSSSSSSGTQDTQSTTSKDQSSDNKNPASEQVTVKITKNGFEPKDLTIKTGDTVIWENRSGADAQVHLEELGQQSDVFANGASVKQKFDSAGSNTYHNHLNSTMAGSVSVE